MKNLNWKTASTSFNSFAESLWEPAKKIFKLSWNKFQEPKTGLFTYGRNIIGILGRFDTHVMVNYNNKKLYNEYKNILHTIFFPKNKPMAYSNLSPIHSTRMIKLLDKYKHLKIMGTPLKLKEFPLKKSKKISIKAHSSLPHLGSSIYVFDPKIVKQIAKKYNTNYNMLLKSMLFRTMNGHENMNIIRELMGNNKKNELNKTKENILKYVKRNTNK